MAGKCTECGRPATFVCEQDGVQSSLCASCATLRAGFYGAAEFLQAFVRTKASRQACPNCGTRAEEVESSGLVGCPLCYEALQPTIMSTFGLQRGSWRSDNG